LAWRARELKRRSRAARHPITFGSELVRQRLETFDDKRRLTDLRASNGTDWAFEVEDPLVTIRIATYNRGQLIVDRALASAVSQTYSNIEILVVGDHCDEATEKAVLSVDDPRIRFVNLAERGRYPTDPVYRWMVAGAAPMNAALAIARGQWIAPCDDDDELTKDHVEILLEAARARRLEFVWSAARWEASPGEWKVVGDGSFHQSSFTHGSVLYAGGLRFFRHNDRSWKLMQPGDWDLWWRMRRAGVAMGFLDHVTYVHYAETQWRN
jgi:glycosyltransferase involved in cell wall biosynthesis